MNNLQTNLGIDITSVVKTFLFEDEWYYMCNKWDLIKSPVNLSLKISDIKLLQWYQNDLQLRCRKFGKVERDHFNHKKCSDITQPMNIKIIDFFLENNYASFWRCCQVIRHNNLDIIKHLRKKGCPLGCYEYYFREDSDPNIIKWFHREKLIEEALARLTNISIGCFLLSVNRNYDGRIENILINDIIDTIYLAFTCYVSTNFKGDILTNDKIIEYAIEYDKLYPSYFERKPHY